MNRSAWAAAVRACSSDTAAAEVLEACLAEEARIELLEIEQLPDWRYSTLLAWQLGRGCVDSLGAEEQLQLRSWQLCGALANACEQAAALGDLVTAQRMAWLLNWAVQRARGTAGLERALRRPEGSRAEEGEA